MIGTRNFKLEVVRRSANRKFGSIPWICRCDCGHQRELTTQEFFKNKSCGCEKWGGKRSKLWRGYGEISSTVFSSIKKKAEYRQLPFKLSIQYLYKIFLKQNRKCALTGEELNFPLTKRSKQQGDYTASLDRIDSRKGYIPNNVQWVHKDINRMKSDFREEYFFQLCRKIVKHNL